MTTRQNLSPNPACGANVTGWGGGSTPTRSTGLSGLPVTTGAHYSANNYAQTPTGAAGPGVSYTGSVYFQNNTGFDLGSKTFYLAFTRSAGGDDFSHTTTVALPVGTSRVSFTATSPALTTGVYIIVDTFNATFGSGVEITSCLLEQSGSLDSYFDGNTVGATWDGTPDNSTSTLSDTLSATGTLAETLGMTATGVLTLAAAGSLAEMLGMTASGLLTLSAGGTAAATLGMAGQGSVSGGAAGATLAAHLGMAAAGSVVGGIPADVGSWNSILAAVNDARAEHRRADYKRAHPIDCPIHMWPLEVVDGMYHCKFGGHVVRTT